MAGKCLDDQLSLLLELRTSFEYDHLTSTKLAHWDPYKDCCQWNGVDCYDSDGRVTGLDLSNESITSVLDNSSALFRLLSLQTLNLADNFALGRMPSAFSRLTNLVYLNLSSCFVGDIPSDIAHLVNLATLDVSTTYQYLGSPFALSSTTFSSIIRNLTRIRELYLDGVWISATRVEWEMVSTLLPSLQVLSMSNSDISGTVPGKLFQVPTLQVLDLSYNFELGGTLPYFLQNGSLQVLLLSNSKFSGILPNSISNLKKLRKIDVSSCNFHGVIPVSILSLGKLEHVDLSSNSFSGTIPSFSSAKNLTQLNLANNLLNGTIDSIVWEGFSNLGVIDLSNNSLTGRIPIPLLSLPLLEELVLRQNKFNGQFNELLNIHSSSALTTLDLGYNSLEGIVPKLVFQFKALEKLDLSMNKFNGNLQLSEILGILKNLTYLDLSHNRLSINANDIPVNSPLPKLYTLGLASSNLRVFPEFLRTQPSLKNLDLSDNKIQGRVPFWVWDVGRENLIILNLSCNNFVGFQLPLPETKLFTLATLDLHSNNIQGQVPVISSQVGLIFLDYSDNNFTSFNQEFGNSISSAIYFSISRNNIYGNIPTSLCRSTFNLEVLDLGYNHLNGTIPDCIVTMTNTLGVLNLKGNNLVGIIPNEFGDKCALETLDLNNNFLRGRMPRSLANCRKLRVLDLGNNRLKDTFPCELKTLSNLKVLVLRANKFYGTITCTENDIIWPSLQILDVGSNHFSGELTARFLFQWRSMMIRTNQLQSQLSHLQYHVTSLNSFFSYQDVVTVTDKHSQLVLQEILTTFTSIDFSDNAFFGQIPMEIGNVNAIVVLNLSHNFFSGMIPSSIGNLTQLESLDISCNAIGGIIPLELANLNFLEYLNLSYNKLSGDIPKSTQLQSFDASSYEGNNGLHGPPLTSITQKGKAPELVQTAGLQESDRVSMLKWMLNGAQVGFWVGVTIIVGPLIYIRRWRQWYYYHVDGLLEKMLKTVDSTRRKRSTRARRN
ncbi:receptor-like protein 7 [Silene latifolia]|uniref:receptor-like protein 7 n=1 Tax=Silene latifolia TaxID=37657 RepID=UPI003D76D836